MKQILLACTFLLSISIACGQEKQEKPSVLVLADIENEPDDAESLVRLLVYFNHFDIEGLAVTTSIYQQNEVATVSISEIAEVYDKVWDNLEKQVTEVFISIKH